MAEGKGVVLDIIIVEKKKLKINSKMAKEMENKFSIMKMDKYKLKFT
jgi:hypothetical protein